MKKTRLWLTLYRGHYRAFIAYAKRVLTKDDLHFNASYLHRFGKAKARGKATQSMTINI